MFLLTLLIVFRYCFFHVLTIWNVRPAGDSSDDGKADIAVDDDRVELEKSNILLMGPTGSGKPVFTFSNVCVLCHFPVL